MGEQYVRSCADATDLSLAVLAIPLEKRSRFNMAQTVCHFCEGQWQREDGDESKPWTSKERHSDTCPVALAVEARPLTVAENAELAERSWQERRGQTETGILYEGGQYLDVVMCRVCFVALQSAPCADQKKASLRYMESDCHRERDFSYRRRRPCADHDRLVITLRPAFADPRSPLA